MEKKKEKRTDIKRKKVAELLADPDYLGNIKQICEKADISRSTFYRWLEEEEFKKQVDNIIGIYTDAELGAVWKALIRECKKGEIPAIKLYFELKNKYKPETPKFDFNMSGGTIKVVLTDD